MKHLKNLKYIKTWFALGLLWVLIVIAVSLYPRPPDLSSIRFGDKIVHSLSYFLLMFWFLQIIKVQAEIFMVLMLISVGIMIEILQGLSGYRTFDIYDMLANSFGVILAWPLKNTSLVDLIDKLESQMMRVA